MVSIFALVINSAEKRCLCGVFEQNGVGNDEKVPEYEQLLY